MSVSGRKRRRMGVLVGDEFRGPAPRCHDLEDISFPSEEVAEVSTAQGQRVLDDDVKHSTKIECGLADRLEHVARRCLLRERLRRLPSAADRGARRSTHEHRADQEHRYQSEAKTSLLGKSNIDFGSQRILARDSDDGPAEITDTSGGNKSRHSGNWVARVVEKRSACDRRGHSRVLTETLERS
jgi:hypothetical protein